MAKIPTKTTEEHDQEVYEFEQKVATETAALEAELIAKGTIEDKPAEPDPRIPKCKGMLLPEAFRRETVDMAFDVLVRLNGAEQMQTIEVRSGKFLLTGYIDSEGSIQLTWKGIVQLT